MKDHEPFAVRNEEHSVLGLSSPTEPKHGGRLTRIVPNVRHAELHPIRAQDIEPPDGARCLYDRQAVQPFLNRIAPLGRSVEFNRPTHCAPIIAFLAAGRARG